MTTWTGIDNPGGANLITNPTFASSGANWTQLLGTWSFTNGALCTVNPGIGELDSVPITFQMGTTYTFSITVTGRTQGSLDIIASEGTLSVTANGTHEVTWTQSVSTDTTSINLVANSGPDFNGAITKVTLNVGVTVGVDWTAISAPSGTTSVLTGYAYGMLMAITRPVTTYSDNWTRIGTPSTTWTSVLTAT